MENSQCVYDALGNVQKVVVARMLPHPVLLKPKIYYYLLTSRVIVTDDYLRYLRHTKLRAGQKVVQIWHACGAFKRFGLDAPSLLRRRRRADSLQYTAVCVSSEQVRPFMRRRSGLILPGSCRSARLAQMHCCGIRRAAPCVRSCLLAARRCGENAFIFTPPHSGEQNGKPCAYDPQINWEALDDALADDELFVIRRHPIMKESFLGGRSFRHIVDATREPTQALLTVASLVVTDYSSVIYDALLCGLPLVFYCPDLNAYERDFYLSYPQDLPGPTVLCAEKLLGVLREACAHPPFEQLAVFRAAQLGACDGRASERVAQLICGYLQ